MLPTLPLIDLLVTEPDADALHLWASDFNYNSIPDGYGCYAFYEASTGKVVYIGGAAADGGPSHRGLRMRLRFYRGRGPKTKVAPTIAKIREYHFGEPLLLRCWLTARRGDAKKYEDDAILLHRPLLNFIGTTTKTAEEYLARRCRYAKNWQERQRSTLVYDPNINITCTRCAVIKQCREFRKNRSKTFGCQKICLGCEQKARELKKHTY